MKYHEFVESSFVDANIKLQSGGVYEPTLFARTQAAHTLTNVQKAFYKWTQVIVLIVQFIGQSVGLAKPPRPAREMLEELKSKVPQTQPEPPSAA